MNWEYLPEPYEIFSRPLWWHEKGLQQTASRYGAALTSSRCVRLPDGSVRRIYVTCFSNAGTAWVKIRGRKFIVRDGT